MYFSPLSGVGNSPLSQTWAAGIPTPAETNNLPLSQTWVSGISTPAETIDPPSHDISHVARNSLRDLAGSMYLYDSRKSARTKAVELVRFAAQINHTKMDRGQFVAAVARTEKQIKDFKP